MEYTKICKGTFEKRPNRFIAEVTVNGEPHKAHVKNTGRCKELLIPQAEIYLQDHAGEMGKRKLRYSLISVKKGDVLINMDSQAPNKIVKEALQSEVLKLPDMDCLTEIRPEKTYGDSRFDFYLKDSKGREAFIEVKGVTLEDGGIAAFPDAPTERGVKHINELYKAAGEGYNAYIIFAIQMKGVHLFRPNDPTHKAFGDALRNASQRVHVMAFDCLVEPDKLKLADPVKVRLK